MKNVSIKLKLMIIIALVTLSLLINGIYTYSSFKKIQRLNQLSESLNFINVKALELRKNEKDFMLRDYFDVTYFKTRDSKYLKTFKSNLNSVVHVLDSLKDNQDIARFDLGSKTFGLINVFTTYNSKFMLIEDKIFRKGYLDYGLTGEFRAAVHDVEKSINQLSSQNDLMVKMLMLRRHEKDYFLRKDTAYFVKHKSEFKSFIQSINRKTFKNTQKQELINLLNSYQTAFAKVISLDKQIGLNEAEGVMMELRNAAHQIQPEVDSMLSTVKGKSHDEVNATIRNLGFFILFIIASMLIITATINRSIAKSIKIAQETVKQIAQGNLNITINDIPGDEMGSLLETLLAMKEKMRKTIGAITYSANNIVLASQQLNSASQQVAEGAHEQASSIEEVSASMEEMVSNIQQSTDNANQTEKISKNLISSVYSVSEASEISLKAIHEIAEKISFISEIAFQTNILALNAAVIAASAGQNGKGFAVIAIEVRKLAERSKLAAEEINILSESSVISTENTKKLMDNLVPEIEKTILLITEIVSSSNEQNSGADQVNSAIQQLNQVTQQNAAASEEMATNSEEFTMQAEMLMQSISYFKV